jgi:hypothetical protein
MDTLTIQPKNKKELTLAKKVLKALDIEFNENKTTYKPDFVASIKQGREDYKNGNCKTIALEDLWK